MDDTQSLILVAWALAGAALIQLSHYYYVRKHNMTFSLMRSVMVVAASGLGAILYFKYGDQALAVESVMLHYGAFLALTIDEIINTLGKAYEPKPEPAYAAGGVGLGALTLSGFWPVYGVGCFGATLAEFIAIRTAHTHRLISKRKLLAERSVSDWALSCLCIVLSGGIVVIHGMTEVNALTALQLGAAGPLLVKRAK